MCGIVGIHTDQNDVTPETIIRMKETLAHRGPDDSGFYISKNRNIALGHTRLSIIELSEKGAQPMSNDSKDIWVSFNGEVYNYMEIREELTGLGINFTGGSDTEVVVRSFEKWGISCLDKFIGMFAIAIWDERNEVLYLVRDRIGVKPLYYYHYGNLLIFGSELRALVNHPGFRKEIDLEAVSQFLKYGYIPCPKTIYKNSYKLEPGNYITVRKNKIEKEKYWDISDYYLQSCNLQEENEVLDELERLMIDSFRLRMVADVPVGMFLSGGIDSSLVTAILQNHTSQRIKTFTIGFYDQNRNEAENAKRIAKYLGTDHNENYFSETEAAGLVSTLPEIFDEPFGDNSALPSYLISRYAVNDVKVALSADGGDELFGGYNRYLKFSKILNTPDSLKYLAVQAEKILSRMEPKLLLGSKYEKISKHLKLYSYGSEDGIFDAYDLLLSIWEENEISSLMNSELFPGSCNNIRHHLAGRIENLDPMSQMMFADARTYLPDFILTKVDRCSMSVSLEAREPYLDHRLIEFIAKLPVGFKLRGGITKFLARKILQKYIPEEYISTKKQGFGISVNKWLRNKKFKNLVNEYLEENKIAEDGIFRADTVAKYRKEFYDYNLSHGHRIWNLLMFQMWKERWY